MPKSVSLLKRIEEMLDTEHLRTDRDLVRLVEGGLRRSGLTDDEIYRLMLPRRTLTHRVARREALSLEESDRVVRLARIAAFGERVFADRERFWRWFRTVKRQFDGRTPLDMVGTEAGARLVEELLVRIDDGLAA